MRNFALWTILYVAFFGAQISAFEFMLLKDFEDFSPPVMITTFATSVFTASWVAGWLTDDR